MAEMTNEEEAEYLARLEPLDRMLYLLGKRLDKGITREAYDTFVANYDRSARIAEYKSHRSYKILDAESAQMYDESVESYAYLILEDDEPVIFQPHDPESLDEYTVKRNIESVAKHWISDQAEAFADQQMQIDFEESMK